VTAGTTFTIDGSVFSGGYTSGGRACISPDGSTSGTYVLGFRYVDKRDTPIYSSLSPLFSIAVEDCEEFNWTGLTGSGITRVTHVEIFRSTAGVNNVLYKIATVTDGTTTFSADQAGDPTLNDSSDDDTLLILRDPQGGDFSLVARRFVPPPDDRAVVVPFQDRYFYGIGVKYNLGTVDTNGTTAVTGNGTDWETNWAGRYIDIKGEVLPLKIASVGSATSLTLETAAANTDTSLSYAIYPDPANKRKLLYSEPDEPESVPATNTISIQNNVGDDSELTALMSHGSYLYALTPRHKYSVGFARQPKIDASVRYVDDRGAFNQNCFVFFEEMAYVMDDVGVYVFDGQHSEAIDGPVHDLWRRDGDGDKLDFTKKDKFKVQVDRTKERVYFFVAFDGDLPTYPTRCLVFNIRRRTWDQYDYPQGIGGAVVSEYAAESRVILAGEYENIYLVDGGLSDVVGAITSGTATASTATTISDTTTSPFVAGMVGAPIYIYEGTGKGQRRRVNVIDSTSQVTIDAAWATNPDTTSKYAVGAIAWNWKTTRFSFPQGEARDARELGVVFKPTTAAVTMDARFYYNGEASPESFGISQNIGDALAVKDDELADVVVNMKTDFYDHDDSVGREAFRFDGAVHVYGYNDRYVAVELRGYGGQEAVQVQEVQLLGVAD